MTTKNYVNDGTASVTAGAKTVTFADVSLALMKPGDQFMQKGASGIIDTLDLDAGTAQLVDNWGGTSTAAQAYTVMTIPVGAELANSTRTIMQYLNGPILSIAMMSGDDAPAAGDTLVWDDITGGWETSTQADSLMSILTTDNDLLQRKSGAVVRRTPSQVLTDLLAIGPAGTVLNSTGFGVGTTPSVTGHFKSSGSVAALYLENGATGDPLFRLLRNGGDIGFLSNVHGVHGSGSVSDMELAASANLVLSSVVGQVFVRATSDNSQCARFQNLSDTHPSGLVIDLISASPNNTSDFMLVGQDSTNTKVVIWSNGNGVNANGSWGTLCDAKLKTNVVPAGSQIADVVALSRLKKKFNKIDDPEGPKLLGVLAQDAQAISPGLIETMPDFVIEQAQAKDDKGDLIFDEVDGVAVPHMIEVRRYLGTDTLGVKTSIMHMKGFFAVGEVIDIIDQAADFADLKAKISALMPAV